MSYYRNYRKPYYYRRRRYSGYRRSYGLLSEISIIIKTLSNLFKTTSGDSSKEQFKILNSEKHGCKCYMEGLNEGEQKIAHMLAENLNYKDYFIFNNLIIPSDHTGSSQIDHLVVSKFGIFVIETKDYDGWIFGNKDQDNWTLSLPGGINKFQFQNPLRQNFSHIMSLRLLFPTIPEDSFRSIVVFTNKGEFKTERIDNVLSEREVVDCIQKYTETKLSEESILLIIGKLSYTCQTIDISPSQHVENLNTYHN